MLEVDANERSISHRFGMYLQEEMPGFDVDQALGTGSPNTVIRMLDTWRGSLAQRLQEVIKLPDVPSKVGQAFAEVWCLAVTHAETLAREAFIEDQNALFAEQTSLTQERKLWEIALAEAQANVAEHTSKLAQADVQLRERQPENT